MGRKSLDSDGLSSGAVTAIRHRRRDRGSRQEGAMRRMLNESAAKGAAREGGEREWKEKRCVSQTVESGCG